MLDKAREVIALVQAKMSGNMSAEQQAKLTEFVSTSQENADLVEKMTTEEGIEAILQQYEVDDKVWGNVEKIWPHRTPVVKIAEKRTVQKKKLLHYIAAAVMVFAIATASLYFLFPSSSPVNKSVATHQQQPDLPPGQRRAMLFLADQSSIALDSAGMGEIAKQGKASVIKNADGTIQYSGTAGGADAGVNSIVTPRGGDYVVTLFDGSKVWLNADSKLTYPVAFATNERRVFLTGQAYFEVAKDPARPFIVVVNEEQEIEVLGTHFDVKAYQDEAETYTTLLEGRVAVKQVGKKTKPVILAPGQQAKFAVGEAKLSVVDGFDPEGITSWKDGFFFFENTPITAVMKELGRWYDITVEYPGAVPTTKVSAYIKRDQSAATVLRLFGLASDKFKIQDKKIIIYP